MAQIKRKKVANNVPFKVRFKRLMHNKLFWWIAGPTLGLIVIASVLIPVLIVCLSSSREIPDYFAGEDTTLSLTYNNKTVEFQKLSYDGVKMVHNYEDDLHIFTFAVDLSTFYPSEAINNGYDEDSDDYISNDTIKADNAVFKALVTLQGEINAYNASHSGVKVALYIVDTSVSSNIGLVTDTLFVASPSEDETPSAVFSYMDIDGLHSTFKKTYSDKTKSEETYQLSTVSKSEISSTAINNAIKYMKNDFADLRG